MSMSGVTCADECVSAFDELRKKKCRYLLLEISGDKVCVTKKGERSASYSEFMESINKEQPCYAAFDFEYETPDGVREKLVIISWNPDSGKPRAKMLYSSSRDALSSLTDGFLPIQSNDVSELEFDDVLRKVKSHRN